MKVGCRKFDISARPKGTSRWIYDFNQQLLDPVERVFLRELADSANAFSGIFRKLIARDPSSTHESVCIIDTAHHV